MKISSKRAEYIALVSLILGVIFFGSSFLLGKENDFFVISALSWLILAAVLVWGVLVIQFHQRRLAEQEKLDLGQLSDQEQTSRIFEVKGEQTTLFTVAQHRLLILEKWFIPIFAALIGIYEAGIGFYLFKVRMSLDTAELIRNRPLLCSVAMAAMAFVSFLMSRYATGMSAQLKWRPLRAGASLGICAAAMLFILSIALALSQFKIFLLVDVLGWVIPALLIIIGVETSLNVIFDIYRPRLQAKYSRSAFDSRLLGVVNEPGGVFHTLAGTIDYQFGFKVSQTWFYKVIEKAVVPLILFAAFVLYVMSCLLIVDPSEQAVIEHFGSYVRTVEAGLHFKYPWPIDVAYKYPTKRISEIDIGYVPKEYQPGEKRDPILWGKSHHKEEYHLLVASGEEVNVAGPDAVPVSLVIANVPVQYRIKDLKNFIYNNAETEKLLISICYQELTRYAASVKLEADVSQEGFLGAGRIKASQLLKDRIQKSADNAGLGVEIVFLGLQNIHPPSEVAADYQKVIGAIQKKQAEILSAVGYSNEVLSLFAGSIGEADELYKLAMRYQRAKDSDDTEQIEKLSKELDDAFSQAKGEIFDTLTQAQSDAFQKQNLAKATGERFASQLAAYQAAPEIYKRYLRLSVLEDGLAGIRKYIVASDPNDTQTFIIDVQEKLMPSLWDMGGSEETK